MGCAASAPADGSSAGAGGAENVSPQKQQGNAKDLEGAGITALPELKPDLEELNISVNPDLTALDGIGKCTKLTKLDANSCGLVKVSDDISGCASLRELLLFANKLKELTPALGSLTELETFNVFNNQVKKLPVEMGQLGSLEEVNVAANKLMMTTDGHFEKWASVKILSMYDNNLVRMGSLAPLVALEELRISGNNLETMPTLGSHPALTVFEIHKNRIAEIEPTYFEKTPALERLSIWGNALTELPPSLLACASLVGVQAQGNKLTGLPAGSWPAKLETLFLQENGPAFTLPATLKANVELKRVNVTKLQLDDESTAVMEAIKLICLKKGDGIFWDPQGRKMTP